MSSSRTAVTTPLHAAITCVPTSAAMSMPSCVRQSPSVSLYDAKIIVSVTSFNAFAKEVVALADGFDPDYETSLWLGPDGHGANGAPYHIRDILDDMDAVQSAYNELADAFRPFVTEF